MNTSSHRFDNFGIHPKLFDDVITRISIANAEDECHIACVDHAQPDTLLEAIHLPINHIVEIDAAHPIPDQLTLDIKGTEAGNLNITTRTAFERLIAKNVCSLLEQHTSLSQEARINIETALHEAIINAVVHGNLEVHSHFSDMDGLQAHYDMINSALETDDFSIRRIHITMNWTDKTVSIAVTDQGPGFEPTEKNAEAFDPASMKPHGMGLDLIKACTIACEHKNGGRTLDMVFAL